MRINKFISYILCNKGIIVNLYKLHVLSFPFLSPTKQKSFLSSHFSTPPTKHIRGKTTIFSILSLFHPPTIFHPPTFPLLHPNKVLEQLHPFMQKKFHFTHLKSTFSILHTYFYKTLISVYLFYTFIQIKYSFLYPHSHRPTATNPHRYHTGIHTTHRQKTRKTNPATRSTHPEST